MRILMWFSIGFLAACAVGAYLVSDLLLLIGAAVLFAFSIVLLISKVRIGKILVVISVGSLLGAAWFLQFYHRQIDVLIPYDGQKLAATATITDYSDDMDYGVAADGKITIGEKTCSVRIYFNEQKELEPGDQITGNFRIRMTTANSSKGATYHQGNGIFLLAYADDNAQLLKKDGWDLQYFPAMLRKHITDVLDAVFPEDTLAFARALLLGDSSLLDYETDTAFKISGIRHVIAVSGLHVSILLSLVYILSARRRVSTALIGIPVLVLFAAVAGFTPSIVRASIMQSLMILALLFDKEYDPPSALAFAVLVMLLVNPLTVTSVGFQLSVGCVAGILLFYERINSYILKLLKVKKGMGRKQRLCRWFSGSVSVTLSAMIVTTPLSAVYFGTVSIGGVVTNLLTLWVVSFAFYGIMLAWVCGAIWLSAGKVVAWVISWPIRFVIGTAKLVSMIPFAAVYTCSIYIVIWVVLCYLLFILLVCGKKKSPIGSAACALLGLILALTLSCTEPRLDDFRMTAFNVGQGQCILIQAGGENYLVDCGGDNATDAADLVAAHLLSQGVTKLDGVFLTHYDKDHAEGITLLLSRLCTENLYLPDIAKDNLLRKELEETYKEDIIWVREQSDVQTSVLTVSLYPALQENAGNESCLCILFQHEKCDILITGDRDIAGERALLKQTRLPDLEILVVGHHGSKNSTGIELLAQTRPDIALISVGRDNQHGHPSDEVLHRLEMAGCQVFRTDQQGTIILRR